MCEPIWLDVEVVEILHFEQIREHGGTHGIRDQGMLDSALHRAMDQWDYNDQKPDICSLATAYAFGLAKNHPYLDGNKRTAAICCELFLQLNGYFFTVDEVAKYPYFLGIASGEYSESEFIDWLRASTQKQD